MTKTRNLLELENQYLAHNYTPLPIIFKKGKGVHLYDINDKKYIDMVSAYSAVSLGHSNKKLVKVLAKQAQTLSVTSRALHHNLLGEFARELCEFAGMDMMLPMNTGAEAVETAIKAARLWGYKVKKIKEDKAEIVVCNNNFHGRTTTIISFSSHESYKNNFGPLTPGFKLVDFGDIKSFKAAITENTCACIIEPIQGEAGIIMPPPNYLTEIQKICKEHNILLILDEVQSGMGRTGKNFAYMHYIDKPDGLIVGKALGGGLLPVSAFLGKSEIMELFTPGSHGSTFGGNVLASAIALATLKILKKGKIVKNSQKLGSYLINELNKIDHNIITAVHGLGLWVGVDINPEYFTAKEICLKLLKEGIIAKETREKTIRLAPPLIITKKDIDKVIRALHKVIKNIR